MSPQPQANRPSTRLITTGKKESKMVQKHWNRSTLRLAQADEILAELTSFSEPQPEQHVHSTQDLGPAAGYLAAIHAAML